MHRASSMVTARRAMLAILRGRFADADLLIATVRRQGVDADVADTPGLVWTLRSTVTGLRRDAATASGLVPGVADLARRLPGQYFEVLTAAWLAVAGRHDEAAAEVDRILPQVLAGSGPNWVWAVAELSFATVTAGHPTAAERLYPALLAVCGPARALLRRSDGARPGQPTTWGCSRPTWVALTRRSGT